MNPKLVGLGVLFVVVAISASTAGWYATDNAWQAKWDKREKEYSDASAKVARDAKDKQTELQQEINDAATSFEEERATNAKALADALRDRRVIRVCAAEGRSASGVPGSGGGGEPHATAGSAGLPEGVRGVGGAVAFVDPTPMKMNAAECNDLRQQVIGLQGAIRRLQEITNQ